jgi:uncharacterized protein YecA (UPF0149 family)
MVMGFEEFKSLAETASDTDDIMAFLAEEGIRPFTDTIGVLSQWHGFSEEYLEQKKKAELAKRQQISPGLGSPITNRFRNIGRNDPCPCGSGKKYKKCCLQ